MARDFFASLVVWWTVRLLFYHERNIDQTAMARSHISQVKLKTMTDFIAGM
jgi:hypothetical protein